MKTIARFLLALTVVAFWTFAGCEEHARAQDLTADDCVRSLSSAANDVQDATVAVEQCWYPDECAVAAELLASANAQHWAALRLCPAPRLEYVDPFETVAATSPEADPAWCAVFGTGCE